MEDIRFGIALWSQTSTWRDLLDAARLVDQLGYASLWTNDHLLSEVGPPDQPKYEALEASSFFPDGRASQQLVPGTVARGQLREDAHLYEGKVNGKPAETFPFPVTLETLRRGQERYNIYCTPCHDRVGNGEGIVVRRGFRRPPSYHIDRLRQAHPGYFYDVITNGFGAMQDYSAQIQVRDRWAIVAYVRALQLSQNAVLSDVPEVERKSLQAGDTKR